MRKSLDFIFVFFVTTFCYSQQVSIEWTALESGIETTLNAVDFVDKDEGWAVGYLGKVLHTTNGGETWVEQSSGTSQTLNSVQFVDSNHGWASASGNNEILRTVNGGEDWQVVEIEGATQIIVDIHFATAQIGYAITYSKIFKSIDGGVSWSEESYLEEYSDLSHKAVFTNSLDNVYVAGKSDRTPLSYVGTVFSNDKIENGFFGDDSDAVRGADVLDEDEFHSIYFTNDSTGYVGGSLGTIYRMDTKSGDSEGNYGWEFQHLSIRESRIDEITFNSENIGAYIQSFGADAIDSYISISIDGGLSWTEGSQIELFDVEGVSFPDLNSIYVVGSSGQMFLGKLTYNDDGPTFLDGIEQLEITLFPNPVQNNCTVQLPANIQFSNLKILSSKGESQNVLYETEENLIKLVDLSQLDSGIYFIQILGESGQVVAHSKLIKE